VSTRRVVLGGLLLAATLSPSLASSQDTLTLAERVSRLETELAQIKAQLGVTAESGSPVAPVLRPEFRFGSPGGAGRLLVKDYYTVRYNDGAKIPVWVAYYLTKANLQGSAVRKNNFRPDPALPEADRSELADYRNSGYDRGHMAPAAAFKRSPEAMSETFLLSNMAPQRPSLNQRIWARLEDQVRSLAQTCQGTWVFTGDFSMNADSARTAPPDSIGPDRVGVPTHFYKVILCQHETGTHEEFAFIIPNSLDPIPGAPKDYLVSVDLVERLTGLDFFAALPDAEEDSLERTKATDWPVQ
jgi:endonuclease G